MLNNYAVYYDLERKFDELYAKSKEGINFNNLYDLIISRDNILLAYRNIKSNPGSETRGTDNLTIRDIKEMSEDEIVEWIQHSLSDYHPDTIRRKFIEKRNGKLRPLGIPTIRDRLIQQCFLQVLEPICEAKFHPHSYGFRPLRSTQHALGRAARLINRSGLMYVVDVDIKNFFDNVNHRKLRRQIWNMGIHDKKVISIISKMLKAPIEGEGVPTKGIPQGGILSPLLANIVLNDLDWWVSSQWETFQTRHKYANSGKKFRALKTTNLKEGFIVRYADDFKIFCRDYKSAEKWFYAVKDWLNRRLGLEISEDKSKITNLRKNHSEFLGFQIKAHKRTKTRFGRTEVIYVAQSHISKENQDKIYNNIKKYVDKIQKEPHQKNVQELNVYIMGVHNYFQYATCVADDLGRISYKTRNLMKSKLKELAKYEYVTFKGARYKDYKARTFTINGFPILPIHAIKHKWVMCFNQDMTKYTVEGRKAANKLILELNMQSALNYIAHNYIPNRSIEYNDNRIALFSAHKGKCYVTGIDLTVMPQYYHCHHKKPVSLEGTDEYRNLVPLYEEIHILVHAKDEETIRKYRHLIKNDQQLKRLNDLRKHCELEPIK